MALPSKYYTPEEYLAFERNAEYKNEYINGQIIPVTSRNSTHCVIALNVGSALYQQLDDSPCLVFLSATRVKVHQSGMYLYPDVSVVCADPDHEDEYTDTLLNPVLLVEVLSPSSRQYNRTANFEYHRPLPSLREYLLVAQNEPRVQHFVLTDGGWISNEGYKLGDTITLPSIGCELPMSTIYKKVSFPPAQERGLKPVSE